MLSEGRATWASTSPKNSWIEDLKKEQLLVYRNPAEKGYTVSLALQRGESISPLAFPDVTFTVEELLGETS